MAATSLVLPVEGTEDLCFTPAVFLSGNYSVDEFVSECRRKVTDEQLHRDLHAYYTTLKTSMVELINNDYTDFLALSTNLVGMDKQIDNLIHPLKQLHQQILDVNKLMNTTIEALENKMASRAKLRQMKVELNQLMYILGAIDQLEMLLAAQHKEKNIDDLYRISVEFNKLRHYTSLISSHPSIVKLHPRMVSMTSQFQSLLEGIFVRSLRDKDYQELLQVLEIYVLIGSQESAEGLFTSAFVRPHLEKIITSKAILTHPLGLGGVLSQVIEEIPQMCQFLFEVCKALGKESGFNFLINGVWPEIITILETNAKGIFNPGNQDNFHKNFNASLDFISQFECQCGSLDEVKKFRNHSSYSGFINKWSVPVYFQIRYQEIAGQLETQLELPLQEIGTPPDPDGYSLKIFVILKSCLAKCWSEDIYLDCLIHKFWKLTLQLMIRLGSFLCNDILSQDKTLSVSLSIKLVKDVRLFMDQSESFMATTIMPKLTANKSIDVHKLSESFKDTCDQNLGSLTPKLGSHITSVLAQQCIGNLEPVNTIPRLYRRTNRDVPFKPSGYVGTILKPLINAGISGEWMEQVITDVTEKYCGMTSEVLNNVKRTEDSLLKLKKNRRSLIPETLSGMSDDNKIRLQLSIDIEHYTREVLSLITQPDIQDKMACLHRLQEIGTLAKTASVTAT